LQEFTVRKLIQLVLLSAAVLAGPAFADMKIAVLNYQMALLESDAAKKYAVDAEKKFGPQLSKLKTLESSAKGIQDRLMAGGDKMQQGERERLELEFKQKARDFQFQSKELNEAKAVADREMLKQLKPKLDSAVEEVIKKGAFDLVFERGSVRHHAPGYRAHESAEVIHDRDYQARPVGRVPRRHTAWRPGKSNYWASHLAGGWPSSVELSGKSPIP
jgi:outer membrane protein